MVIDENEHFIPRAPSLPSEHHMPRKDRGALLPLLIGFFLVILTSAGIGVAYYKNKLVAQDPTPLSTSTPTPAPSLDPSPSPSVSPSPKSSLTPVSLIKFSPKPTPSIVPTPIPTPTPSPAAATTLDIRFGNPSANIKQTIDEGSGDGRVINREFSSVQSGVFDEVPSSWTPRVSICFHFVSNEEIKGSELKFNYSRNGTVEQEGDMGQYDKLEAGRLYDWCHEGSIEIGKHTAELTINPTKSLKEISSVNNVASISYENIADNIAPNFTIGGPYDWNENGTCLLVLSAPTDNVTKTADLKIEKRVDDGNWVSSTTGEHCFIGDQGDSHTYEVKVSDLRGNANTQKKSFVLY